MTPERTPAPVVPPAPGGTARKRKWELLHLSREGRLFTGAAVLVLLIGLVRNINLLTLLGYLLLCTVLLNWWLAGRQARGIRGRRRILGRAVAGKPVVVEVVLEETVPQRRGRRVSVVERGEAGAICRAEILLSGVGVARHDLNFPRRGRQLLGALEAVSSHPFGLVERRRPLVPAEPLVVLAAAGTLQRERLTRYLRRATAWKGYDLQRAHQSLEAYVELHRLRAYQPGDSPRHIHWKTSARCGQLIVREYEGSPSEDLLLILDTALDEEDGSRERFEQVVSFGATVCEEWGHVSGVRLALAVTGAVPIFLDGPVSPGHVQRILEAFAVVEPVPPGEELALPGQLVSLPLSGMSCLLLSAQPSPLLESVRQLTRRPVFAMSARDILELPMYQPPPFLP